MKSAARRMAVMGASAVVVAACLWPPDVALPALAKLIDLAGRACAFSASIVLEAAPYILVGAVCAALAMRVRLAPIPSALLAMIAPGCDCSMNGFAAALARAPAPVAAFAIVWSAACNPIALVATHAVLGDRVVVARITGALVAGTITAFGWKALGRGASCEPDGCFQPPTLLVHFAAGLTALAPAAVISATLIAAAPHLVRAHLGTFVAVLLGAVMSPCSTADAILAKTLATTGPAQTAFILAAQLLDVRQLTLLITRFGVARAAVAVIAAVAGCATAVAVVTAR